MRWIWVLKRLSIALSTLEDKAKHNPSAVGRHTAKLKQCLAGDPNPKEM